MTLNYKFEFLGFRVISQIWEATAAKRMKIDPYCQRQDCSPLYVFSAMYCVDIAGHSSARGITIQ